MLFIWRTRTRLRAFIRALWTIGLPFILKPRFLVSAIGRGSATFALPQFLSQFNRGNLLAALATGFVGLLLLGQTRKNQSPSSY